MQVAFGVVVHLQRDKAPNSLGPKTFGANPTGAVCLEPGTWDANVASVGCQLVTMALHQGLLMPDDLKGLKMGEAFTIPELIRRRGAAGSAELATRAMTMYAPCPPRLAWYICTHSRREVAEAASRHTCKFPAG